MSLTETERKIKQLEIFQFAYEGNYRNFQKHPTGRSLEDGLNAIGKNKTDYITYREELIKEGLDISNFPSKLNYMEMRN